MKTIKETYSPYNFSFSKCHVVELIISQNGVTRIEAKLPFYIRVLTGIYITCKTESTNRLVGYISVFFNEGVQKSLKLSVINPKVMKHHSQPIPLNQELNSNSSIQGFYLDNTNENFPYTVKIYLHYKK